MKILMIAPEPIFEPRGTPLSVVGRLKALSDMGHEVDLLTYPMGEDVRFPGLRIYRIPSLPGIRRVKIGPSLKKIPLDFFLMCKTVIQLLKTRYDIIHTHEEAGFWGIFMSRLSGIPHVYDMHSSLPQQLENFQFTRSPIWIGLFRSLENWVLKYAAGVITICPDLQQYVQKQLPGMPSMLIENVVDYGMIFESEDRPEVIRDRYGLRGRKVVLYTGTFEPYQGLDLLIESAAIVLNERGDVLFLMVGGHPDQVEKYRMMAGKAGISDKMIFTGQVPPNEVSSFIQCADILVSPRKAGTNTPLKLYAYLRSGVPVVATNLWTHVQVLNERVSVLTEANPVAFARGMLRVLRTPSLAKKTGREARALASERYSYPVYLSKLESLLRTATTGGR